MTSPTKHQEAVAKWSLFMIGVLLLVIAIFTDPVGSSPDSGIIDLGSTGIRWLLGSLGGLILIGGAWKYINER